MLPVSVEVAPHGGLLSHKLGENFALLRSLNDNLLAEALVVTCGANHVEKRENGVERIPDDDDALVDGYLSMTNTLWVVRLNHPNAVICLTFSVKAHLLQLSIQWTL